MYIRTSVVMFMHKLWSSHARFSVRISFSPATLFSLAIAIAADPECLINRHGDSSAKTWGRISLTSQTSSNSLTLRYSCSPIFFSTSLYAFRYSSSNESFEAFLVCISRKEEDRMPHVASKSTTSLVPSPFGTQKLVVYFHITKVRWSKDLKVIGSIWKLSIEPDELFKRLLFWLTLLGGRIFPRLLPPSISTGWSLNHDRVAIFSTNPM